MMLKWPKKFSRFGQNVWKYKLIKTDTARLNTNVRQMIEMFPERFVSAKMTEMSQRRKKQPRSDFVPG